MRLFRRKPTFPFGLLGEGRVFASHYQIVLADGPDAVFDEPTENWTKEKTERGYAGNPRFRMFGTKGDYNDHWVELVLSDMAPDAGEWERIIPFDFECQTRTVNVKGILDDDPIISAALPKGRYCAFACGINLGCEHEGDYELDDATVARRRDLEWYRIVLVPAA